MSFDNDGSRIGRIEIHISEDGLSASLDLHPPQAGAPGYTVKTVLSDLESAGVVKGIDENRLEKAILKSLTEERHLEGFIVARGQKPRKSVPSYWHLKKRLVQGPDADLSSPNVDYRKLSPFVLVKKGEALAKMVPESPGEPGFNVLGDILPVTEKDIVRYDYGENIIEKDGVLYAACAGRFEIKDRVMTVNETLEITGNVDYSTGHIAFPGDVIINGEVGDGFRVAAGKSMYVKETLDASEVITRGDLIVNGGLKGRGDSIVRVGGSLKVKFVENSHIEARGNIAVEKAIVHSDVVVQGFLDLGEAGSLVGGDIWAKEGMRAGSVGRPESPAASIRVGSDYMVDRKLRTVRAQMERLETKIDKLRGRPGQKKGTDELIQQADNALEKMKASERELVAAVNPNRNAKVIIIGQIDAGTKIQIADLTTLLNSAQENVTFYYDADGPRIGMRTVSESEKGELRVTGSEDAGESAEEQETARSENGSKDGVATADSPDTPSSTEPSEGQAFHDSDESSS